MLLRVVQQYDYATEIAREEEHEMDHISAETERRLLIASGTFASAFRAHIETSEEYSEFRRQLSTLPPPPDSCVEDRRETVRSTPRDTLMRALRSIATKEVVTVGER